MKRIGKSGLQEIERGDIFYLKRLAITVTVISNKLHNLLFNYLTVGLVTDKNVDQVRESLEVSFKLKEKKLKILASCFHTISKKKLQETGEYLGRLDEKTREKLDNKIRSILDL